MLKRILRIYCSLYVTTFLVGFCVAMLLVIAAR